MKDRQKFTAFSALCLCLAGLAASLACDVPGPDAEYKRQMKCADRISNEKSVQIAKVAKFGCDPLPSSAETPAQARRFYLQKAWGAKPDAWEPAIAIAQSYWEEADFRRALDHFNAARERAPKELSPVIGMITMFRLLGEYQSALDWSAWLSGHKAIDAVKVSSYLEGRIYYEMGDLKRARPLLESAIARADSGDYYLGGSVFTMRDADFFLAQIYFKGGDSKKADEHFRRYVKMVHDPDFMAYMELVFEKIGGDQARLYSEIEKNWVHGRQ